MKSMLLVLLMACVALSFNARAKTQSSIGVGNNAAVASSAAASRVSSNAASLDAKRAPRLLMSGVISPWSNLLGGVLLGLSMGGLLSVSVQHQAVASNLSTLFFILLGMCVLVKVVHWLRSKKATRYDWETYVPEIDARIESAGLQLPLPVDDPVAATTHALVSAQTNEHILGFDASVFINHAKTRFICLQVAWDKSDFNSIRSLTTPAMYAALRQQAQKPDRLVRHTDVVQLFGTLLTVRVIEKEYIASVSFEGLMKPLPDASAEPFSEIWHITRPLAGQKGWALAGIQKIS